MRLFVLPPEKDYSRPWWSPAFFQKLILKHFHKTHFPFSVKTPVFAVLTMDASEDTLKEGESRQR